MNPRCADLRGGIFRGEAEGGDMSYVGAPDPSMTPKEEEEYLLLYGPPKERKALKKRRKAEEALRKQSKP
jgi:hypothetical protein